MAPIGARTISALKAGHFCDFLRLKKQHADGSVTFISENIDMETLRQLCVRDDGKVVGEY